jgi:hypothetical protein
MPIDLPTRTRLLSQVPSSRADPPKPPAPTQTYTISIQRRESAGEGRWYKIASWRVTTTETDMMGPLSCGLRDNYRVFITQEKESPPDVNSTQAQPPDDTYRVDTASEQAS